MDAEQILATGRWDQLADFVATWYAEPLGASLLPWGELIQAETRLGRQLPVALREWYLLVGHRLTGVVQDWALGLDELKLERDRLPIWRENQGCWLLDVEMSCGDDEPWASVIDDAATYLNRRERLVTALVGMVYSDTIVGVWAGAGEGPLGPLAPGATGGFCEDVSPSAQSCIDSMPPLDVMRNPSFQEPFRGTQTLVVRDHANGMCDWMAATPEALTSAIRFLEIEDPRKPRRLVVLLDEVPQEAKSLVQRLLESGFGEVAPLARFRSAQHAFDYSRVEFEFETLDPDATIRLLVEQLPQSVIPNMRAGHRLEGIMRFVSCWPPGATNFAHPI